MKSDLEIRPDPEKALVNLVNLAETVSRYIAKEMKDVVNQNGMEAEVSFSVRADGNGAFMLGQNPEKGQFRCVLRMKPQL